MRFARPHYRAPMSQLQLRVARPRQVLAACVGLLAIAFVFSSQQFPAHAQTSVIDWEATEYAFTAPDSLTAGLVTIRFKNLGQEVHHAQLLRLNEGVSFAQFAGALQTDGEAALRFTSLEGGPGAIDPQGTSEVTLNLAPGNYVLACLIPDANGVPHVAKGMLKPVQVNAAELPAAAAPDTRGMFTMEDFSFDMPAKFARGYLDVSGGQSRTAAA